jgi:hypothetical protein
MSQITVFGVPLDMDVTLILARSTESEVSAMEFLKLRRAQQSRKIVK